MFESIYSRPTFSSQMPQLFIIKIWFTIKVDLICGAGRNTRNLCHKLDSEGPVLRILGLSLAIPKFQGPNLGVLDVRFPVPGSWVSGFRVTGFQSPGSQSLEFQCPGPQGPRVSGLRIPGPESQVLILDYVMFLNFERNIS